MKNNLQFDFLANKEDNTLTITREFNGSRRLVWKCYTESELLDQWFAPMPLITKTKTMDFREGGHWHYAMVEPGGGEYWNLIEYITIAPIENYTAYDAFSNEAGEINEDLPRAHWLVSFLDKGENAIVKTTVTYDSLNDLEKVIEMGVEQGLASTLDRLDTLLLTLNK